MFHSRWSWFDHLTYLFFIVFASICLEIFLKQISGRLHETIDCISVTLHHFDGESLNLNYFHVSSREAFSWCIGISKDMFLKSFSFTCAFCYAWFVIIIGKKVWRLYEYRLVIVVWVTVLVWEIKMSLAFNYFVLRNQITLAI